MLRMNDQVIGKSGINGETALKSVVKSYPRGSVPVWKLLAKVPGLCRGERSQRGAAMPRDEGACQHDSGGWRFGLTVARTPALTVKREDRPLAVLPASPIRLLWQANRVLRVATWRKRSSLRTIELPRRSRFGGITAAHKAPPKRSRYASVRRTNFLRPAFQGTQQDQSSRCLHGLSCLGTGVHRQPSKVLPQVSTSCPFGLWEQSARQLKPHSARGVPLHASTCLPLSNTPFLIWVAGAAQAVAVSHPQE
jgi:hypothetical protein